MPSRWDQLARERIERWRKAKKITQDALGAAAGHNQSWYTRWLKGGFQAGLAELGPMAEALDQTLAAVFDEAEHDKHLDDVLGRWGGLSDEKKQIVASTVRSWVPDLPAPRSRQDLRTRGRSDESSDDSPRAAGGKSRKRETRHR